jgi:hypothetical protein
MWAKGSSFFSSITSLQFALLCLEGVEFGADLAGWSVHVGEEVLVERFHLLRGALRGRRRDDVLQNTVRGDHGDFLFIEQTAVETEVLHGDLAIER